MQKNPKVESVLSSEAGGKKSAQTWASNRHEEVFIFFPQLDRERGGIQDALDLPIWRGHLRSFYLSTILLSRECA
jgi:hypothetical protein